MSIRPEDELAVRHLLEQAALIWIRRQGYVASYANHDFPIAAEVAYYEVARTVRSAEPNFPDEDEHGRLAKLGIRPQAQQRRPVSESVRKFVMARDNRTCQHCGTTARLSIDHIQPQSKGGGNEPSNLQVLCVSCNSIKGDSFEELKL